jgi:hypothetical protein
MPFGKIGNELFILGCRYEWYKDMLSKDPRNEDIINKVKAIISRREEIIKQETERRLNGPNVKV